MSKESSNNLPSPYPENIARLDKSEAKLSVQRDAKSERGVLNAKVELKGNVDKLLRDLSGSIPRTEKKLARWAKMKPNEKVVDYGREMTVSTAILLNNRKLEGYKNLKNRLEGLDNDIKGLESKSDVDITELMNVLKGFKNVYVSIESDLKKVGELMVNIVEAELPSVESVVEPEPVTAQKEVPVSAPKEAKPKGPESKPVSIPLVTGSDAKPKTSGSTLDSFGAGVGSRRGVGTGGIAEKKEYVPSLEGDGTADIDLVEPVALNTAKRTEMNFESTNSDVLKAGYEKSMNQARESIKASLKELGLDTKGYVFDENKFSIRFTAAGMELTIDQVDKVSKGASLLPEENRQKHVQLLNTAMRNFAEAKKRIDDLPKK